MSTMRELAEAIPCPRCMALVGEPCRTDGSRGGRPRTAYPHTARSEPIRAAFLDGHREGIREGVAGGASRVMRLAVTEVYLPAHQEETIELVYRDSVLTALAMVADAWDVNITEQELRR